MSEIWYNKTVEEVKKFYAVNEVSGLTTEEVKKRQEQYGLNELKAKKQKTLLQKFLAQFKDFMIIVLIISAVISGFVGVAEGEGITDTIIILVVVIANAIIGVIQENKAEKSLEALQKMSAHAAKVIRNGRLEAVPSKFLVPGDIVVLETGDFIPADLRITEAFNLKSQESALTGESVPVEKTSLLIKDERIGVGDRINMLFSSSLVTYGRGKGIVVETGMNTEVGKIADIINNTEATVTPLQEKLDKLGKTLGIAALIICAIIFIIGTIQGKQAIHMFMTAVSLAVAAIPEGLPAVATIVLAIGVQRMVKRNAIVKTLPAVETLGSATVICSDKTGTLTQNRMTVEKLFYNNIEFDVGQQNSLVTEGTYINPREVTQNKSVSPDGTQQLQGASLIDVSELQHLLNALMLCNDTKMSNDGEQKLTGDPTETALIDLGLIYGIDYHKLITENPREDEIPFESDRKLMTTVNFINNKYVVYTKGAVDELLKRCARYTLNGEIKSDLSTFKENIERNNVNMATNALRVIAAAYKELDHKPTKEEMASLESDLIYIGQVAMIDPPREEAKVAVEKCKEAGIKPVMITGDHKITAIAIAKSLGILENEKEAITGSELEQISDSDLIKNVRNYAVYARVSPEHKVRIVKAWQANGEIVAMTGDGVNDAPALKTADIGCAMGIVGTDVAKEAADVILTDDNFATVVASVEEGRRIYDNILKAIQFLLSSNVGEIITLFVAILITPLLGKLFGINNVHDLEPLLPIHILWINLVTDSLPALALSVDPAAKDIMKRKPVNPKSGIFTKGMTFRVAYQGIMIGTITLIAFIIGLNTPGVTDEHTRISIGQTMAFSVLALSQLVHVYNIRDNKKSVFKTGFFNNKKLILANAISAALMITILIVPAFREIFSIVALPVANILEVVLLVFAPIVVVEIFKLLKINTNKQEI